MPIPKPKVNEDQDKYIGRCIAAVSDEFDDEEQAAAVCHKTWRDRNDNSRKFAKNTLEAEIFDVGLWNGIDFTIEDLKLISAAFSKLKEFTKIPLKMGHNDEQPFTDGQPALGWVENIWMTGTKLMAKFVDIPDVVFDAMQNKLYKNVSIELEMGVEHKGDFYPWVLSGVALLGADIPAVNTLADLTAYMRKDDHKFQKRVVFTAIGNESNHRSVNMDLEQENATLKAKNTALQAEVDKLVTENTALKTEKIEMGVKFKAVEQAEQHRKQLEERGLLEKQLEAMVTAKKIAPFTRDEYLNDYDQADDKLKATIMFSVEKLEKTIDANPAYFGAEQARKKAEKDRLENDKSPADIVLQRTNEYMATHGEKNFSVAKKAVLRADSELATRYVKGED